MFEKEWMGISFQGLKTSAIRIADSSFYDSYYDQFFSIYTSFEEMNNEWKTSKEKVAHWIMNRVKSEDGPILSIGAGLGYIEKIIYENPGDHYDIYIQDISGSSSRWIRKIIPEYKFIQKLDPSSGKFNYIYLSNVEYAFSNPDLIQFLNLLSNLLIDGGKILIISTSFEKNSGILDLLNINLRSLFKFHLAQVRLLDPGQFWGYVRTKNEFQKLIKNTTLKLDDMNEISGMPERYLFLEMSKK